MQWHLLLHVHETLRLAPHEQVRSKNPLVPFPETGYAISHTLPNIEMTFDSATRSIHHIHRSHKQPIPAIQRNRPPTWTISCTYKFNIIIGVTSSPVVGLYVSCQLEFSTMTLTIPLHTIPQQHRRTAPANLPRLSTWRAPECRCLRWCKMQSENQCVQGQLKWCTWNSTRTTDKWPTTIFWPLIWESPVGPATRHKQLN